uniref:Uncharacterized protein n=1 Tax=Phaeocystis antarctica TaxID=33657 RepID=A0A7S0ENM9_9EUKA
MGGGGYGGGGGQSYGGGGGGDSRSGGGGGDERREPRRDERDEAEQEAKRARADEPKPETATEKLARLRAKQASLGGMGHFGRVGADYASKSDGSAAPAKGIQRYQQMMKDGRT